MLRGADRRQGIHHVVLADQGPCDVGDLAALKMHRESASGGILGDMRQPTPARAEELARLPAAVAQSGRKLGILSVYDEPPGAGHGAQQLVELAADRSHVRIDIRVIVFQIIEDRGARTVMHEFGALVEKRRVVLVRFDDEERGPAQAGAGVKIAGHAADQVTGFKARVFEDPREQGGGGGLAMSPGHRNHVSPVQHLFGEPQRPRGIGHAAVEHGFDDRTAAAQCIAHDHHIGRKIELLGAVALDELDAQRLQLSAHRRIYIEVRAGDAKSGRLGDRGHPAHECAAYPQDMDMRAHVGDSICCSIAIDNSRYPTLMIPPNNKPESNAARQMWAQASKYQMSPAQSTMPVGMDTKRSSPTARYSAPNG